MSSPPKGPDPFDPPRTAARGNGGTRVPVVSGISDRSWCPARERELIPASSIQSRGIIPQSSLQERTYDDDLISTRTLLVGGVDTQPGQAGELHDRNANIQQFPVGEPPHGFNTQFYLNNPLPRVTRTMGGIQHYPIGQPHDPFHGILFAGDTFHLGGSRARQFVVEPPRPAVPHGFYDPFTSTFQSYTNIQPYAIGEANRSAIPHSFYNPLTSTIQTYANVQQHPIGENGDRSPNPSHVRGALQMNGANAQSYAKFIPHRSAVPPTTNNLHRHNRPSFESIQQYLVGEPHVPDPLFNPSFAGGSLQARGALAHPFAHVNPHKYGDAPATQSVANTQTHTVRKPHGSAPTIFNNPNLNCLQSMGNIQGCPISSLSGAHAKEWKKKNPESSRITSKGKVTFPEILTPLGTRCSLCNIDLAFEPTGSSDGRNHPITAVMSCGHCYHVDCLELIGCPMQACDDPPCLFCTSTLRS